MKTLNVLKEHINLVNSYKKNKKLLFKTLCTLVIALNFTALSASYSPAALYNPFVNDSQPNQYALDILPLIDKAKVFAEEQPYQDTTQLYNYIVNILYDPLFQADPENFIADWKRRRGNTREFRIPEDQALVFFTSQVLSSIELGTSKIINTKDLSEKAIIFVEELTYPNETLCYIIDVIENPAFQQNPHSFMQKWREERGLTLEFRYVEDSARRFFEQELR